MGEEKMPARKKQEFRDFHTDRFEIDGHIFIYDFNRLAHNRVNMAKMFVGVSQQVMSLPPETLGESQVITAHANTERFWDNIFIKIEVDENGKEREVDQDNADYDPILKAKGSELYERKEVCKNDFFIHARIISKESMMQLETISRLFKNADGKINLNVTQEEANVLAGLNSESVSTPTETSSKRPKKQEPTT